MSKRCRNAVQVALPIPTQTHKNYRVSEKSLCKKGSKLCVGNSIHKKTVSSICHLFHKSAEVTANTSCNRYSGVHSNLYPT